MNLRARLAALEEALVPFAASDVTVIIRTTSGRRDALLHDDATVIGVRHGTVTVWRDPSESVSKLAQRARKKSPDSATWLCIY